MHYGISRKSNKMIALLLAILMICAPVLSMPDTTLAAGAVASSYYVDGASGSDTNDGLTTGAAFKTIQAAANIAQSGDTVLVRAGVYRETVTPNSGVTIKNYNGEAVTVSGADLITGWTLDSTLATGKKIYVADMNWDMYNGDGNIVFADGTLMQEATFPNFTLADLLDRTKYPTVKTFNSGATSSIVDATGLGTKFAPNTLIGGMLWFRTGNAYGSYTASITGNPTSSTINISLPLLSPGYPPAAGSYYYITRNKLVLDVDNEWYKDVANGKLFFIAPGNVDPSTIAVEAKKRDYAFDFSGKTNVTIEGIKLRAANLNFANSSYNMVKGTLVDAPDYNLPSGMANLNGLTLGLNLNGDHNTIRDSEIRNMYGPGILVDGHDNNVINNYIHNVNFLHSYADAVKLNGYNHLVSHNTLTMAARGLVGGAFSRSVIQYNDMSQGMRLSGDGGAFYIVNLDMENTEIHHNVIHDITGAGGSHGFYPDNSVHNLIFYNNVIYGTTGKGILMNVPNEYHLYYNNTINKDITQFCNTSDICDSIGSTFINNIVRNGYTQNNSDIYRSRNLESVDPQWNSDYSLKSTSAGFEQGAVIPGVTDGYMGSKPEMGAIETGVTWKAGHDFINPPTPTFYLNPNIPYKNLMNNAGFERNSFEEWTVTAGTPSLYQGNAWDYKASSIVRFGQNAVRLKAGDAIAQTITGLKPNTTYTLSGWGVIQGTEFEAENYNASSGTFSEAPYRPYSGNETCLCGNAPGAWVKYNNIDFGNGLYNSINFAASQRVNGGKIDVKLDSLSNPSIATYTINVANDTANPGAWMYNKADTPITTKITGVHNVYLVFSTANQNYLDKFRLSNTDPDVDDAIIGVKDFGGTDTTASITERMFSSTTKAKKVVFTTGPNNTTATIFASKQDGNFYAFLDGFGVSENVSESVLVPNPNGYVFKDGFEDPYMDNWISGTAKAYGIKAPLSTTIKSEGLNSYAVNEDRDVIYKVFPTSYSKTASLRFYDDNAAAAKTAVARVDGGGIGTGDASMLVSSWSDATKMYALGVMTGTSQANYSFKLGNVQWAESSVARTAGWHELKWDYSSGKGLDMYIDNILVASTTEITGFNMIAMGDWTGDAKISTANFDDVRITEWADDVKPRLTLPNNLTVGTTGSNAVVNFTVSAYDKTDGPLNVTTSLPSGTTLPIGQTTVNCSVTDSDGNTVNGSFVVNVIAAEYFENFENGLTGWVPEGTDTPVTSSVKTVDGSNSFVTDKDNAAITKSWSSGLPGKVISVKFYDENVIPDNTFDKNSTRSVAKVAVKDDSNFIYMGVDTISNTSNYIYRYAGSAVVATNIPRSKGWHEFKFDFSSGTIADLYIDGVKIKTVASAWDVSKVGTEITLGDLWGGAATFGQGTYPTYFDNLMIAPVITITASAGSNGSISPSGSITVTEGTYNTYTFTPDNGYMLDTVLVDGTIATVTSNTYTFANVTSDHTIDVTFKQITNNGSGGIVVIPPVPTPDGTYIIDEDQLSNSENGSTTVEIPANTTEIKLPGNTAELIKLNNLEIKSDALTLSIPSEVLKQLTETLSADELKGGTISLKMAPISNADAKELINKSSQSSNSENKLVGDVYEFNLSIQTSDGKTINLSKFDKPITIELKVDPSMNPKFVGIYYIANDGKLEYVGGKVNNGVITAEIKHFSKYAVLEVTKTFTDVPSGHWASNVIKELAAKQILNGTSVTTFEPGRSVTRAEFTVLLVRALKLTEKGQTTFADVKSSDWYADAVSIAVKAGIVQGKSATLFDANAQITREEMVTLLLRAYELKNGKAVGNATHSFADENQVSSWANEFVKTAAALNLIQGREDNKFDPRGITTRAEAAQVLYNLLLATQTL